MKVVNQSIGRAIRHINDYAIILLIDDRFKTESISRKLPTWIQKRLFHVELYEDTKGMISKYSIIYQ